MAEDQTEIEKEIGGEYDLDQITKQIRYVEVNRREFESSSVSSTNNKPTNNVKFRKVNAKPTQATVILKTEPLPADAKQVWSGTMVVSNTLQQVVVYR